MNNNTSENQVSGREEIERELLLTRTQVRWKLFRYSVRTLIAVILYVIFWKHQWVRWSLFAYVPLNLLGLAAILFTNTLIKKRTAKIGR